MLTGVGGGRGSVSDTAVYLRPLLTLHRAGSVQHPNSTRCSGPPPPQGGPAPLQQGGFRTGFSGSSRPTEQSGTVTGLQLSFSTTERCAVLLIGHLEALFLCFPSPRLTFSSVYCLFPPHSHPLFEPQLSVKPLNCRFCSSGLDCEAVRSSPLNAGERRRRVVLLTFSSA